jgi:hypothetical protein
MAIGTPESILFFFPFSLMRKEPKNQGKTKLLPALAYCSFFKQGRQCPLADKLRNSPFTPLLARLPIAIGIASLPHIAHGKFLGTFSPFSFDFFGVLYFLYAPTNRSFVLKFSNILSLA